MRFRLRAALAALAAVAVPSLASAGTRPAQPVAVNVEKAADSRGVKVDIRATLDAPLASVEAVIEDAGAYAQWMPNVTRARALGGADFETTVHLPWPLHNVTEQVRVQRTASRGAVDVSWRQLRGDLIRDEGHWTLVPRGPRKTEVHYQAAFQLRSWIPMFLIRMAQHEQAPKLMTNLGERAAQKQP